MNTFKTLFSIFVCVASLPVNGVEVLQTSHWGAYIVDSESGEEIFSHNASRLFIPASLTKLFTTLLALDSLGIGHTFKTSVETSAPLTDDGIVHGNLYLIGGGDPSLKSTDLHLLAEKVHDMGVRTIMGTVTPVDSLMNGTSLATHAEWDDLTMGYCPEICSLSINDNAVRVTVAPNLADGGQAIVQVDQEIPYFEIINNVETVTGIEQPDLNFERGFTNNVLTVSGVIPVGHALVEDRIAIHDPSEYVRQLFIKELKSFGIEINEIIEKESYVKNASFKIAKHESPPLVAVINNMNKTSNNFIGAMLFKYIGGSSATSRVFNLLGIPSEECQWFDGGGLSRHNLLSPNHVVKLLQYMDHNPVREAFIASLAIAGIDGTLSKRFTKMKPGYVIQAKTGSMSGLKALAGYAKTPSGKRVTFAMIINNSRYSHSETIAALDDFLLHQLENL